MNLIILNQYGLHFYKTSNGAVGVKSSTHVSLAAIFHMPEYKIIQSIEEYISLINLALAGNYNQIDWDDTDIGGDIGSDVYYVIINSNMTLSIALNNSSYETYPLSDIKEIYTSWLEFLQS
jgi:hypothetical protein